MAAPVVTLPGGFPAGWLSALDTDGPVSFQFLDGPKVDADALRTLAAKLIELAAACSPTADRPPVRA